jgi:microcin C transport system permease protein
VGYAIPGFVLAIVLIVLFGGGSFWNIFPLRGLVSDNFAELSLMEKVMDYLWHMVLPVISSTVGSLAVMTLLTKNSFLEEIRKQYVLTARAKGLGENRILYHHVFRNAIIPIITGFPGSFVAAFFTGSLLIETIFSLDGMGLLAYDSIINRDYPVVLGTLYFFTIIGLISRLLSDLSYVVVDPRITFESVESQ